MVEVLAKIAALIPTYDNDKQNYLDMTIESLRRQEGVDLEIIVASSCVYPPKVPEGVKLLNYPRENSAGLNVNLASKTTDAEFIILGNDDLIFAKQSVWWMWQMSKDNDIILNSLSNCDLGLMFHATFAVKNEHGDVLQLGKNMRMDQIKGFEESLMNLDARYPAPLAFEASYLCTYATMIRKDTWDKLGGYDVDGLEVYGIDTDLCWRAKELNVKSYTTCNSFVFHFGGVTTYATPNEVRLEQMRKFGVKWPQAHATLG